MKIDSVYLKRLLEDIIKDNDNENPLKLGILFSIKIIEILEKVSKGEQ